MDTQELTECYRKIIDHAPASGRKELYRYSNGDIFYGNFKVHPEFDSIRFGNYQSFATVRFDKSGANNASEKIRISPLANPSERYRIDRREFLLKTLQEIRNNLGLSQRQLNFFARAEFGATKTAHLHILYDFYRCDYEVLREDFYETAGESFKALGATSIELRDNWDHMGLCAYCTAIEKNEFDPEFHYSPGYLKTLTKLKDRAEANRNL